MNIILWILQIALALVYLLHGRLMISPPTAMAKGMQYVFDLAPGFRQFIGIAEVLAAVGLILPALTNILPWLTPLAATGLVILMASAAVFHVLRHEYPNVVFNLILLALATVVAYMRWSILPF